MAAKVGTAPVKQSMFILIHSFPFQGCRARYNFFGGGQESNFIEKTDCNIR